MADIQYTILDMSCYDDTPGRDIIPLLLDYAWDRNLRLYPGA